MQTLINQLLLITVILVTGACDSSKTETSQPVSGIKAKDSNNIVAKERETKVDYKELLQPKEDEFEGYLFKFGYEKYDEDSFGFENPGYFQVLKDENIIFKDKFKGEGEVYVKSLGYHELSGNKLIFTLNWGTEACDYSQHSGYYFITPEGEVQYLNSYWSGSSGDGYSSRYFETVFPEDSAGIPNSLLIVEGINFHEHYQPDLSDTTKITFTGNSFTINKPTNNIDKAK